MSEANVEIVRRFFDLLNRREFDELVAITPPDFQLDRSRSRGFENKLYRGPEGVASLYRELEDAWDEHEFFETEMIDAGDVIVRIGGTRGRGRGSGIEVSAEGATVWWFRDGVPVAATLFQSKDEALEAAGLSQ